MTGDSLCPHFGTCGGCATQNVPYDAQLAEKESRIRRVMQPFAPKEFDAIRPSPDVFYYRNKMEFAFGGLKDAPPLLGLRQRGKFDRIVDLMECRLLSPMAGALLGAVRGWVLREGLPTYHLKSHKGFLRYLVVREGKNTGQRMVVLVTADGELPRDRFVEAIQASGVPVDTVVWSVNAGLSDVAWGETRALLAGTGLIEDRLGSFTFRLSPRTFFQTNTRGAEVLYGLVRDGVREGGRASTLFDIYCGSGSIGLFCADAADRVVGVELNPQAVADAQANAREFGISHGAFYAMDASAFAVSPQFQLLWTAPGAVAVMDPPRPGLSPEVRRLLLERPVQKWLYVSCNPESLARDLAVLASHYAVEKVQPVDLFPHTPHVETVVHLVRRGEIPGPA